MRCGSVRGGKRKCVDKAQVLSYTQQREPGRWTRYRMEHESERIKTSKISLMREHAHSRNM